MSVRGSRGHELCQERQVETPIWDAIQRNGMTAFLSGHNLLSQELVAEYVSADTGKIEQVPQAIQINWLSDRRRTGSSI